MYIYGAVQICVFSFIFAFCNIRAFKVLSRDLLLLPLALWLMGTNCKIEVKRGKSIQTQKRLIHIYVHKYLHIMRATHIKSAKWKINLMKAPANFVA